MEHVEGLEDPGDLPPHQRLRLAAPLGEPGAEIAVLGEFHDEAVAGPGSVGFHEPVEHLERPRLPVQQLAEVGLPQPPGDQ
ncbi:MAG: hypothetical protein R2882_13750 [Gemmatimonadales bacterium]